MATVSQATLDKIQAAINDESAATAADNADAVAVQTLQAAENAEAAAKAQSIAAHQQSTASGMDALRTLAAELQIPLPTATVPSPAP
jgi:hypothetical protein